MLKIFHNFSENTIIAIKNVSISVFIKGLAIIVSFLSTPALISFFDNNKILGVWFTVLSVLTWMLNVDMGIGNGLRNYLVYAIKTGESKLIGKYVVSGYVVSLFFVVCIGSFIYPVVAFGNWYKLFNIDQSVISEAEMRDFLGIIFFSICCQFVLRLVNYIFYAIQKAFIPSAISLLSSLILFIYIKINNIYLLHGDLKTIAMVYFFSVNVPLLFGSVYVFLILFRKVQFSLYLFNFSCAKKLVQTGLIFFMVQLFSMIIDNSSNFLITNLLTTEDVVIYQIYNRIFNLPTLAIMIISATCWSLVTKAKAESNYIWLRKVYHKMLMLLIISGLFYICIIPVLEIIFNIWLGDKTIGVNYSLSIILAIFNIVMIWRIILTTFANGLLRLRLQFCGLFFGAIAIFPVSLILTKINSSLESIVLAYTLVMLPYCIAQTYVFCKKF